MTSDELIGDPLVYVDCGARGQAGKRFLRVFRRAQYLGFEPDAAECARLTARKKKRRRYFPAALGGREETRCFYLTQSPACASLLRPNPAVVNRFLDCAPLFEVTEQREVRTVTLDGYLRSEGVTRVDVLKLDTQGSELDILRGAERFLGEGVLAVEVEVEFAPLYTDQPLFGDIDQYLRGHGLRLFDLARYRGRRTTLTRDQRTRGQLLWGQALYLRDHEQLPTPQARARLAALADFYGCHDYAVEILEELPDGLSAAERRVATALRDRLLSARPSRLDRCLGALDASPLQGLFRRLGRWTVAAADTFLAVTDRRNGTWRD